MCSEQKPDVARAQLAGTLAADEEEQATPTTVQHVIGRASVVVRNGRSKTAAERQERLAAKMLPAWGGPLGAREGCIVTGRGFVQTLSFCPASRSGPAPLFSYACFTKEFSHWYLAGASGLHLGCYWLSFRNLVVLAVLHAPHTVPTPGVPPHSSPRCHIRRTDEGSVFA
jgi:hypothetical protein